MIRRKKKSHSYLLPVLAAFLVLMASLTPSTCLFAQKRGKGSGLIIKDFDPSEAVSVLRLPLIDFPKIGKIDYFEDRNALKKITALRKDNKLDELSLALYAYIKQFGIRNFRTEEDMDLIWQLARLAEYFDNQDLAKDLYRLIIKHFRGDLKEAVSHYDTLTVLEKDLWVDLEDYYKLVERRNAIDTLRPPPDVLINMGNDINSYHEDYGPATFGVADDTLFFTSKRQEEGSAPNGTSLFATAPSENIFFTYRDEYGDWLPPSSFAPVNTQYNEGSPCLSRDGRTMFFVRCNSKDSYGNCDIYATYLLEGGQWSESVNLGPEINTYAWDSHPALSVTEDTLFFASNRRGGFGGIDLYLAVKQKDGTFGQVKNLGPIINTKDDEVSPFIHPINNVLYFSSNGHLVNFGNFDIFKSYQLEGKFVEPKNIGPLVNSEGFEFYFTIDKSARMLYYAKSATGDMENLDLHSFPLPMEAKPDNTVRFSGRVVEPTTGEVFKGVVSVIDLDEGVEVAPKYLRDDGSFSFELQDKKEYLLIVEGDNFFNIRELIFIDGDMDIDIPAEKRFDTSLTFSSIDFETGSATLKAGMENNLHLIIDFLNDHPTFGMEVIGHTDSDGSPSFNLKLSYERAKAIKEYIVAYGGIAPDRIEPVGKGDTDPLIFTEKTERDKQLNRRVEFKILYPEDLERF